MRLAHAVPVVLAMLLTAAGATLAVPAGRAAADSGPAARATSTAGTAAAATAISVALPPGAAAGDLLVARIANRDNVQATLTAPDGWTAAGSTQSAAMLKSWVFTKLAGKDEPAAYRFSVSASTMLAGSITAIDGVDQSRPVDSFIGKVNGNSASLTGPSVTTGTDDAIALWFGTQLYSGSTCASSGLTAPSDFSTLSDQCATAQPDGLVADVGWRQLAGKASAAVWSGSSAYARTNIVQVLTVRPALAPSTPSGVSHRATTTASALKVKSLTVARPAGTAAGDLLLARIANRNDVDAKLTAPSGWSLVRADHSASVVKSWVYRKIATAAEPSRYTFNLDGASSMAASVSAFAGVNPKDPLIGASGQVTGSSTTFTTAAVASSDAATAVWFGTQAANLSGCSRSTITQPDGFAEPADACLGSTTRGLAYDFGYAGTDAVATQDSWTGSSATAATNIAQAVVLRPADQAVGSSPGRYVTVGQLWDGLNADGSRNTAIPPSELYQPSGLAASRTNPGVVYVESEKDRQTMVAVRTSDAAIVGAYTVTIPGAFDWEDVAVGPCPSGSCVYAGDIGGSRDIKKPDNVFSVTRVPEPDISAGTTSGTLAGDTFFFTYPAFDGQPAGQRLDAESLMVHPATGGIYVITKDSSGAGLSRVFAFPEPLPEPGSTTVLRYVATLHLPTSTSDTNYARATAAAIHPAGNRFLLRTYRKVYEFRAPSADDFESAFAATPVALTDTVEPQGESIDYASDGSAYFTLSEAEAPPYTLKRVDLP